MNALRQNPATSPWRFPAICSKIVWVACVAMGLGTSLTTALAASYRELLPRIPFADSDQLRAMKTQDDSVRFAAKSAPQTRGQDDRGRFPASEGAARKIDPAQRGEASRFGKVRTDPVSGKVLFSADYILLRGVVSYQRHVFHQGAPGELVVRHRSQGIDFDYEEFRVTADLGAVRIGGEFYGAEESGAKLFGEWLVAKGCYVGTGFSAVTKRTHQERYRREAHEYDSNEDKWNTYSLSAYLLHTGHYFEAQAAAGLSRKRFTRHGTHSLGPAADDDFHRDFRSGFGEVRASAVLPLTENFQLLLSYSYYYERMYQGVQLEGPVKSAVDGSIENHYLDLLHIRYRH